MIWKAKAPANIALIKYPSISYTLSHLLTFVEVELHHEKYDKWELLEKDEIFPFFLSEKGQNRFLKHVQNLKTYFDFQGNFTVRSGNNFPSDCGLASSASSYAALTKVMVNALSELTQRDKLSHIEQAHLSRKASGSSGRSFFSPWCLWDNDRLEALDLPYPQLIHQAIVVDRTKKTPSSSEAHLRVTSSALFENRPQRATHRLSNLINALNKKDWEQAYQITWAEFWDMHALFETSMPPFGYMTPDSLAVLQEIQQVWHTEKQGPLVTLDAGPNIHLLYPLEMEKLSCELSKKFQEKYLVVEFNPLHP
jgi:diphosphomevalonate decarboxylase